MKVQTKRKVKGMKTKGTRVTQEEYETVQTLYKNGLSIKQIATALNRAGSTIGYLVKADSLEDYLGRIRIIKNRNRLNMQNMQNRPTPVAMPFDDDTVETVEASANELAPNHKMPELERIADALESLVDAWENTTTHKKGWLK